MGQFAERTAIPGRTLEMEYVERLEMGAVGYQTGTHLEDEMVECICVEGR